MNGRKEKHERIPMGKKKKYIYIEKVVYLKNTSNYCGYIYLESMDNGKRAYPCMTALVWVRCAWAQLLFPAALPHTAALQSQTGNPWCWSAAGWPPDQGALTPRPVPRDECLPLGYAKPRESLHASPDSGGSREGGDPGCAFQLWEQTVGGLL